MATVQAIRELLIRARSEGVDKVAGDLNKVAVAQKQVADAALSAAKVTEDSTRSQLSAAKAFDRTAASIDPAFRAFQQMSRAQRDIDRALAQGVINNDQYAASLARMQARYGAIGVANNNLVGQTGNLAAQFNDIAVQLAGGQSPFLIALQQGTQISQVLGETGGGARGAVKALGEAFLSVLSPVNLLTIGMIGLGGTLIQYLSSTVGEVDTLDDRLKAHADLIKQIKGAYGEAAEGVDEYARQSASVLDTQLRASIDRLQQDLEKMAKQVARAASAAPSGVMTNIGTIEVDLEAVNDVAGKYDAFGDAIRRLREEAQAGNPNIRAFREEVSRIAEAAKDDKDLRKYADELLKSSEKAAELEAELRKGERGIRALNNAAGDVANLKDFNKVLEDLSRIALPNLTPQQQALEKYREAIGKAGGREERAAAQAAYEAAIQRAGERDAEKAAEQAARQAEADAKRREQTWERAVDRIQDQTRALEQQAATYGMGAGEIARYRAEQELLNAAWEAGKADTPTLRAQIAAMANEAGAAADRMEHLRQAAEWDDFSKDTLKGFISDLRQGKSAADAFANALERIADRILDMTLNWALGNGQNPFAALFGGFGGSAGGGGALRSIPTMAQGGYGPDIPSFMGLGKLPDVISSAVEPITKAVNSSISAAAKAIRTIESGSAGGNYGALGVLTKSGDRAYGAYQVMGNNVGPWSEKYFGQRLTPSEFLSNSAAQDAVFNGEFGRLMSKYGPEGASRAWFAGERGMRNWGATDANGTSVGGYNSRFGDLYQRYNTGPQALNGSVGNDNLLGGMGQDMRQLSGDFNHLSQSMSSTTPQITQGLTSLTNVTHQGGQSIGGALQDTAGTIGEGADGVGGAIQKLMQSINQGGGGGGLSSLFGGGGGDIFTPDGLGGFDFSLMHSGGLVGRDASGWKNIHPAYFDNAPRYHDGLRPDEVPAILQQGEWVLSRDDVAAIRAGRGSGGPGGVTVNHTVVDNAGTKVEHETRQNEDGSIDILTIIDERAKDAVRRDVRKNGGLSRELNTGFKGRG